MPTRTAALLASVAVLAACAAPSMGLRDDESRWKQTLERVVPAVVAIRIRAVRNFDTESARYSQATGFVVDAARGLILTNRHVVQPGPVVAEAVFADHEEVELRAVYRDPVHDFGLYRFDPAKVRFQEVRDVSLRPDLAAVGVAIRVVGNDAGEKLSILDGTLARLDRHAPNYGTGRFNDFNTFYLQAASGTSGGSSGSPVIDIEGNVIGLNAGGSTGAASSFYLPLDRVVRALSLIQAGRPVTRGTLQTVLRYRAYDEVRRLGVRPETEAELRRLWPGGTGMLVVEQVVPGGPADGVLEPGDVVVRLQGQPIHAFVPLDAVLDERVGQTVELGIERGGEPRNVTLTVGDLHAVTPAEYLEVGDAVLNPLSYQQARSFNVPARGAYVASSGYMLRRGGVFEESVITHVAGQPVPDLDALEKALVGLADGQQFAVRSFALAEPRVSRVSVVPMDRRWFPMRRCSRDDSTGLWPCRASADPPPPVTPPPATTSYPPQDDERLAALAPSLVWVQFHVPYRVDGVHGGAFLGTGLVLDAARGLVAVDRNTVPVAIGDVTLRFAGSVEIPGKVRFLHPLHNLAIVSYDPALLGDTPVRAAELAPERPKVGTKVWVVGFTPTDELVARETKVAESPSDTFPLPSPPRFRETNLDFVDVEGAPDTTGGVVVDEAHRVVALWGSFAVDEGRDTSEVFRGIPAGIVAPIASQVAAGGDPVLRTLGIELVAVTLADARNRGLTEAAAKAVETHDPRRRRVLGVRRVQAGTPAAALLQEGDLLVEVGGKVVTRFHEVEAAWDAAEVAVRIVRDGQEQALSVPTIALDGRGTDRVVRWAGLLVQEPHRSLAAQRGIVPDGVYTSWWWAGSPAQRHGVWATWRITEVDGTPTPDLDTFLAAVRGKPDGTSLRLKTVELSGKEGAATVTLDLRYWPHYEIRRTPEGWVRTPLD